MGRRGSVRSGGNFIVTAHIHRRRRPSTCFLFIAHSLPSRVRTVAVHVYRPIRAMPDRLKKMDRVKGGGRKNRDSTRLQTSIRPGDSRGREKTCALLLLSPLSLHIVVTVSVPRAVYR